MNCQTAYALPTDISSTPLSSGTTPVLPNVMFILDDSSSMAQEALPDYVEAASLGNPSPACPRSTTGLGFVPAATGTNSDCNHGDAPYYAGGANGFNGIYYDPTINYLPGVKSDGTPQIADYTSGGVYDLNHTSLTPSAYVGGTAVNLTSATFKLDRRYCNINNLCKRNGETAAGALITAPTDNDSRTGGLTFTLEDGQFPYRAHKSNSSSQVSACLSHGRSDWTRSSTTITVTTVEPHNLATGNRIYLISSNGNNTNASVTVSNATTFPIPAPPPAVPASWSIASTAAAPRRVRTPTVTVVSTNHGLVVNDRISTFNHAGNSNMNRNDTNVTVVVDANTFRYTSATSATTASAAMTWVRNALYNIVNEVGNYPTFYTITPSSIAATRR